MRHIISPLDFSAKELEDLLSLASDISRHKEKYKHVCEGKKLATLFYEPSTRTRLSFEAAMLNLGGSVLGFSDANSSSVSKGESVADTIRVVSSYADICAMRHSKEGAPMVAARYSRIPVINRSAYNPRIERDIKRTDNWYVRRFKIRPYCAFINECHGAVY